MIHFTITKRSAKSKARLGSLKTSHGSIQTPAFVPVATQATIKALTAKEAEASGAQILIANTFHLHLKPGEKTIKKLGGIHNFMHWSRPLMTDSAGFQVFSLGFGSDFNTTKISKKGEKKIIKKGSQPHNIKITEKGVYFRSPLDGSKLFIGPEESIHIQQDIGADIILAFDECPPPLANKQYHHTSMNRTHRWAKRCLDAHSSPQTLFGIVQGGQYKDLRTESAQTIGSMPFDGFGIGGEFGSNIHAMETMLDAVITNLPDKKPRHLLGIGHLKDIVPIIKKGVDTFDCIVPTHYARHGYAFVSERRGITDWKHKKIDITKRVYKNDASALDPRCKCEVCTNYTKGYIHHLIKAREITGITLLTMHNLYYFNEYVATLRLAIKSNKL